MPYYLIDAGWAWASNYNDVWVAKPETDITRPAEGIDIAELVRYAASKGVGILLLGALAARGRPHGPRARHLARWGVKGVRSTSWSAGTRNGGLLPACGRGHRRAVLLLDLHGAYVPAGFATQLLTSSPRKACWVQWNKMTKRVTPKHNLMPSSRACWPAPSTTSPGGFRHASRRPSGARQRRRRKPRAARRWRRCMWSMAGPL